MKELIRLGWREWLSLPELSNEMIKAKIDTGAATSSLYAAKLEHFSKEDKVFVRFVLPRAQKSKLASVLVEARLHDERRVKSSNGQIELRPVIKTKLVLGERSWPIEITLTDRRNMGFRMLLGREALRKHALVDVGKSYLLGKPKEKA